MALYRRMFIQSCVEDAAQLEGMTPYLHPTHAFFGNFPSSTYDTSNGNDGIGKDSTCYQMANMNGLLSIVLWQIFVLFFWTILPCVASGRGQTSEWCCWVSLLGEWLGLGADNRVVLPACVVSSNRSSRNISYLFNV